MTFGAVVAVVAVVVVSCVAVVAAAVLTAVVTVAAIAVVDAKVKVVVARVLVDAGTVEFELGFTERVIVIDIVFVRRRLRTMVRVCVRFAGRAVTVAFGDLVVALGECVVVGGAEVEGGAVVTFVVCASIFGRSSQYIAASRTFA